MFIGLVGAIGRLGCPARGSSPLRQPAAFFVGKTANDDEHKVDSCPYAESSQRQDLEYRGCVLADEKPVSTKQSEEETQQQCTDDGLV